MSPLTAQENTISNIKQKHTLSMSLVDFVVTKVPGARKITDRSGNKNISLRGRQSFSTASDEVIWEIDGIVYKYPPYINLERVVYVEVLNGLASTNKYGSEGAAGVIIVKTNVNAKKFQSRKNLLNHQTKSSKNKLKKTKKKS
tara:strand:- start:1 stop:429 length:429 start_codon:yes stop_codon:yes gene_type:complete